jgi:hypothetical protein
MRSQRAYPGQGGDAGDGERAAAEELAAVEKH